MFYCSKECQKKDWRIHKLECKIFKDHYEGIKPEDLSSSYERFHDHYRLLLRVHLTLEQFPDQGVESFKIPGTDPAQYRSYDDLRTCKEKIKIDEERSLIFKMILRIFFEAGINFDREKLFEHFCKILINRFIIENFDFEAIGLSIFVLESGLEHSCVPNASLVFNGINLQVRALKNISKDEKITINYVTIYISNGIISQESRQKILKERYYFTCSCPKCLEYKEEGMFL